MGSITLISCPSVGFSQISSMYRHRPVTDLLYVYWLMIDDDIDDIDWLKIDVTFLFLNRFKWNKH